MFAVFAPKVKALIGFMPPWEAFCDQMPGHDGAMEQDNSHQEG